MNKKSIAARASSLYPRRVLRQFIRWTKRLGRLSFSWETSVPKLDAIKQGLMTLGLFWRRLAIFAGSIRAQMMVEVERNPLAVRQGAATIACIAAAAVAMPVISHRAAEQRAGAEWAARSISFQADLQQQLLSAEPTARIELTAFRRPDGLGAHGTASLFSNGADTHALLVEAALRGPLAPSAELAIAPTLPRQDQINPRELGCLSQAIYYEARGESRDGQIAVGEVVMNRVRSPAYPNTVCAVVYQGSHRTTGCQFTFTCDGSLNRSPRGPAWARAREIATQVILGYARSMTQRATHYHTTAVNPVWASGLVETTQIGSHIFYRFPNRSERPLYQAALARRLANARVRAHAPVDDPISIEVEQAIEAGDEPVEVTAPPEAPEQAAAPAVAIEAPPAPAETLDDPDLPLQTGEVAT